MTSVEIRQSFLDYFRSKEHTIVPSSSLMPDAPNLLFTNAGMNQFVPIFLGQKAADVSRWAGAIPGKETRAADTQKCIRAGGKHNDLEDVGLDTYHHTFFEMLGNWSFGDYFKKEAIEWAWELVAEVWKFPKERLYATVYEPDKSKGDPSQFDQEAYDHWARLFSAAGLEPKVHVRTGGKADNFWMMGDTGPCGPCSELHMDLTAGGDTAGALVNKGTVGCIEIWNLVFIQFNADPDGGLSVLPSQHVDTGMGFERVTAIIQNTSGFTDFTRVISNYETDIFRPLFDKLERLSGRKYGSTLPVAGAAAVGQQEKADIAFRVIADHIRTLSFAIADGIQPGNTDRNYVLRRILRRAVRYGRSLGFRGPFFYKLVDAVADTLGSAFPELRGKQRHIQNIVRSEEETFNKTLDRGIEMFNEEVERVVKAGTSARGRILPGDSAFKLYDTYGFPVDLTELMARERGLAVDTDGFNRLMEEQRKRARKAQKKEAIELSQIESVAPTAFVGYDRLETAARVLEVVNLKGKTGVVLDTSVCYAEMGGQVGDRGELAQGGRLWRIVDTRKCGDAWLHILEERIEGPDQEEAPLPGSEAMLVVDAEYRAAVQRHHTATHLLHWALRERVNADIAQKGSFVGPDKLTFDFNSPPLTPEQVVDVERLVNERAVENAPVSWTDVKYDHVRHRRDIRQCFGEKYGEWVRVVQIGGRPAGLDGYSMELCGGTHCRAVGEIGLFRVVAENAIAAGVRRIEAVAGLEAYRRARETSALLEMVAQKVNAPLAEIERRIENLIEQQRTLEKQLRGLSQKQAAETAKSMIGQAKTINGVPTIIAKMGTADADTLQSMVNELKGLFKGVVVLGGVANGAVALVASVSPDFTPRVQAGKLIQQIAPLVGGKGGGKADNARGGGKETGRLDDALARAGSLLG